MTTSEANVETSIPLDPQDLGPEGEWRGNDVRLEIWEGMHHVFQAQAGVLRSSGAALERVAGFLREAFGPAADAATAEVVRRFIAAFEHKDPAAIPDLVAPDCIMETRETEGLSAIITLALACPASDTSFAGSRK
jgi:hypothetical protein